ncbi:MAG: hypothetical protein JXB23_04870 [Candidatus Aminicenantes bacterium]|nr:hypothetical protein [Candidatus Aminicenantes bacterium]
MKRYPVIILLALWIMGFIAQDALAYSRKSKFPDNYLNFSFFITPMSIGLKHQVAKNVYFTGNMDYDKSDENLIFQGGAAYMIPRKIVIFHLYGGTGLEYTRNSSQIYPYFMVGTKLWIIHFDIVHPLLKGANPGYRLGFMFSF